MHDYKYLRKWKNDKGSWRYQYPKEKVASGGEEKNKNLSTAIKGGAAMGLSVGAGFGAVEASRMHAMQKLFNEKQDKLTDQYQKIGDKTHNWMYGKRSKPTKKVLDLVGRILTGNKTKDLSGVPDLLRQEFERSKKIAVPKLKAKNVALSALAVGAIAALPVGLATTGVLKSLLDKQDAKHVPREPAI
jgi:hypothetical protein